MNAVRRTVDVVILAGGDGEVIDPSCRFKGLLPIAGRPLIEWVVDAFLEARTVHEVAVVMPTAENLGPWVDKVGKLVVSDSEFMDNVLAGLSAFRGERLVLCATGDTPLITPDAIDDFVDASLETGADFTYPLITQECMETAYPGSVRTYFRLKSGTFTGGNMMIVDPVRMATMRDLGQELFNARKSPVRMLRVAGIGFVAKFLLGRLDPEELVGRIPYIIGGGTAAPVLTEHACLAVDVDKPSDREMVEAYLVPSVRPFVPPDERNLPPSAE